jgi:hypothetical protein
VPGLRRVAVLADALGFPRLETTQDLVKPLGITLTPLATDTDAKLDAALGAVATDRPTALVMEPGAVPEIHFRRVADCALRHRLPSIPPYREATEAGMLMSYGYNINDLFRHAAVYVVRASRPGRPCASGRGGRGGAAPPVTDTIWETTATSTATTARPGPVGTRPEPLAEAGDQRGLTAGRAAEAERRQHREEDAAALGEVVPTQQYVVPHQEQLSRSPRSLGRGLSVVA